MGIDEARDLVRENHRADRDDYRAATEREGRVLLRLTAERAGPDRRG